MEGEILLVNARKGKIFLVDAGKDQLKDDGKSEMVDAGLEWAGFLSKADVNRTVRYGTHLAGDGVLVQVSGYLVQG